MSRRPMIAPNSIINAHSTAASFNGQPTYIGQLPGVSWDVSWTGTTHGTFSVQVSNSYTQNPDGSANNSGNWATLPSTAFTDTLPAPAGSPGSGFINVLPTIQAAWIRLVFTRTDGTGALTAIVCSKVQ